MCNKSNIIRTLSNRIPNYNNKCKYSFTTFKHLRKLIILSIHLRKILYYLGKGIPFDTVPHKRLFAELKASIICINRLFFKWIEAFLKNRKQRIVQ